MTCFSVLKFSSSCCSPTCSWVIDDLPPTSPFGFPTELPTFPSQPAKLTYVQYLVICNVTQWDNHQEASTLPQALTLTHLTEPPLQLPKAMQQGLPFSTPACPPGEPPQARYCILVSTVSLLRYMIAIYLALNKSFHMNTAVITLSKAVSISHSAKFLQGTLIEVEYCLPKDVKVLTPRT